MTDRADLNQLLLQIERDLLVRASLRTLLAAAHASVLGHRQELRDVNARIGRKSETTPRALHGRARRSTANEPFLADTALLPSRRLSPGQGRNR